MNDLLVKDLQALTVEGNIVKLPKEPLNDYPTLKKVLLKATGKYKRNTFEFSTPAQPIIDKLLSGEIKDLKKELQFFETPEIIAQRMIDLVLGFPKRILEPSAGHGALIDKVLENDPQANITAVEISELNYNVLKSKYNNIKLIKGDFLEQENLGKFDLIIANPPFSNLQDIDHFYKMWELLDDGGQLIIIMSTSYTFSSRKKVKIFRAFLEAIRAEVWENERGAFKTSGTMTDTVLVFADKPKKFKDTSDIEVKTTNQIINGTKQFTFQF